MRIKLDKPLPKIWSGHPLIKGLVLEDNIRATRGGRLRAKLLVFDRPASLRHFWKKVLGKGDLGKGCLGAVSKLAFEVISFEGGVERPGYLLVDPTYFCIISLCKTNLSMEIICHESVHAGFAYEFRTGGKFYKGMMSDSEEERVCYPAGAIAAGINRSLHKNNLYTL